MLHTCDVSWSPIIACQDNTIEQAAVTKPIIRYLNVTTSLTPSFYSWRG